MYLLMLIRFERCSMIQAALLPHESEYLPSSGAQLACPTYFPAVLTMLVITEYLSIMLEKQVNTCSTEVYERVQCHAISGT